MKNLLIVSLLALLCVVTSPAKGWSREGHRMVGILAATMLNPTTQSAVAELLSDEPEPTLEGVAYWADEARKTPEYEHTAPWHYVNITGSTCHYAPERDCPDGDCVVAAINRQLGILGDRTRTKADRIEALRFVVHFIGDIHQPLHASGRDDLGGNTYQINYRDGSADGQGTNLHGIWDFWILSSRESDDARYASMLLTQWLSQPNLDALPATQSPVDWAEESCRLVEQPGFYPKGHVIQRDYLDHWRPLAERRLRDAAVRLAEALNRTLGSN